jgi:hypothetical protein
MNQLQITFEKPNIKNREEAVEKVRGFLKDNRAITKPELCALLGWHYNANNDRRIRDIVSEISHNEPIISVSGNNKGFQLARSSDDVELVKHTILELRSRIAEIEKRIKPLEIFLFENKTLY